MIARIISKATTTVKTFLDMLKVWGSAMAITIAAVHYVNQNCEDCWRLYWPHITLATIIFVVGIISWLSNRNLEGRLTFAIVELRKDTIEGKVDAFFRYHKDDEYITADDAKYLYKLKEQMDIYDINGFTKRKISHLLSKNIAT